VTCEVQARDLRQLRAYLRSAERLAAALDRSDIADAARVAVAALDAGRVP
jgi:Cu2+-containing amine oxidase